MKKFLLLAFLIFTSSNMFSQKMFSETIISIKGTTINNIGDIKEIWETGSSIYLNYERLSANHFSYSFQIGYMNFKQNSNYIFNASEKPNFTVIPIQVGGRYYIALDTFRPFVMAMSGVNVISTNYPVYRISHDGEEVIVIESGTETKLNFQVGIGLAVKLFSNLQLEVIANYNSHILDAPVHYNLTGYEIGGGISWVIDNSN